MLVCNLYFSVKNDEREEGDRSEREGGERGRREREGRKYLTVTHWEGPRRVNRQSGVGVSYYRI